MAIGVVKNESSVALVEEVTEGTYVAPSGASDFVEVRTDANPMVLERDELTRDNLSSTVETEASRVGVKSVSGELPMELRANSTEGDAPVDLDLPLKSLLGGKRSGASTATTTGNSSTVLNFASHPFSVGDMVVVQRAGLYEMRPISASDATSITFPFALENGAPPDATTVAAVTTYYSDPANSITMSSEWNKGGSIQDQVAGLRAATGSITDWTVGALPGMNFSLQGLDLNQSVAAPTASPATNDALPPVILESCFWMKVGTGSWTKLDYPEFSLNIENTISQIQSACDPDGRIASRITQQVTTASINPFMEDDDVERFTGFNANDDIALFGYAFNSTGTAGEFDQVVGVYLPQAKITAIPAADVEGIFADAIELKAHRSAGNDSVFLSFS